MATPTAHPVDPFLLSRYSTAERVAVMNRVIPTLIAHAAALVDADDRDGARFILAEAAEMEAAISACRRSDECGASPV